MANDFFSYGAPPSQAAPPAPAPAAGEAPLRLLSDLADEDWEKFIGYTARRRYPAGATIVRAGDRGPALFLVASGQVRVLLQGAQSLRGEGEVIGLLSFLDGAPHAADLVAAGEVELLMLTPDALTQLAAWQPRIALALLRDLGAHTAARLRKLQPGD
jgi:CRP/FNR family transcriptional regulator, cyclic AMP receptor protein